jgi:DNA polymerase-3 subunit epsilon
MDGPSPSLGCPLSELPVFVFDTETTGLDVKRDHIVSVGGVRMHGRNILRDHTIDRLVNPGRPIPPRSTRIHGISDEMVETAPAFGEIWPDLSPLMGGAVLVGHNIGFDIAHVRRAAKEARIDWRAPVALDTLLLYAALKPRAARHNLEDVAAVLGVVVRDRHTALGDAVATAEVFRAMIPLLLAAGVRSLGEALRLSKKPRRLIRLQRRAGW